MSADIKIPRGLYYALEESRKSTYKQKIGACIMAGSRVLSRGFNSVTYNSTGVSKYTNYKISTHAERDAASKVDKENLKGATIYIAREYNGSPERWAYAKPCECCMAMIKDLGFKKVVFSIPEVPFFEIIKL